MILSLNDRSLITSFVQIVLRDISGLSVKVPHSTSESTIDDWYEVTSSSPLRVTGTYDLDTYGAAALFMAVNFPNEQFPYRYDEVEGNIIETPFDRNKLKLTLDWIKSWDDFSGRLNEEIFVSHNPPEDVFDWTTLFKYFDDVDRLEKSVESLSFASVVRDCILVFIVHNYEISVEYRNAVNLPERVLSYFFNEVVAPTSPMDEIYRVQKKIYDKVPKGLYGIFTDEMTDKVCQIQRDFIDLHSIKDGDGRVTEVVLPEGFEGFKVTGYVDPWTEMIINGGV